MISDQQLELAAREYCRLANLDPGEDGRLGRVMGSLKTQWMINTALQTALVDPALVKWLESDQTAADAKEYADATPPVIPFKHDPS